MSQASQRPVGPLCYVALGSNLGESAKILREALARMQALSAAPLVQSALWQSSPVDCPPGSPMFVNALAGLRAQTNETPESLLGKLQAIEKEFGRPAKKVMNEARPLDLDLIAFGTDTRTSSTLTLPHPRAHLRRFVLQPLNEIAPRLVLPGQSKSIGELLAALPLDEVLVRL